MQSLTTPQNLVVFGATGATGRLFLEQALAAGHGVTAFVRNPSKLDLAHERLQVEVGDVLDAERVAEVITGHDAVVSLIGAPPSHTGRLRARGTEAIVAGMQAAGVERLLSLSTYGIRDTAHVLPWFLKYVVVPLYLKRAFADHAEQEELVEASGLRWTLVRPPTLTDGPATGSYQHGFGTDWAGLKLRISRSDVAGFLVEELARQRYIGRAVAIAG